jgi:chitodextrinase
MWTAATDPRGSPSIWWRVVKAPPAPPLPQIVEVTSTTYSDTGLAANTSYSYRVRATNAAGSVGPYSNVASATTQPF